MVMCVGLDTAIDEANPDTLGTRSLLYRAISRAHMVVMVVNELLPSGWLAHLTRVRLKEDQHFDQDKILAENDAASRWNEEDAERQKLREDEAHTELEKRSGALGTLTDEERAQLVWQAMSKVRGGATVENAAEVAVEYVTRMRRLKQLSDRVSEVAAQEFTPPPSEQALRALVKIAEVEARSAAEVDAPAAAACKVWHELRSLVQELILGTVSPDSKELEELTADAAAHLIRGSDGIRDAVQLASQQWLRKQTDDSVNTVLKQVLREEAEEPTDAVLSTTGEAAKWQLEKLVADYLAKARPDPGPACFQEASQQLAADAVRRAVRRWQALAQTVKEEVEALALTPANGNASLQEWTAKALLSTKELETSNKEEQAHTVRQVLVPEMVRERTTQTTGRQQQFLIDAICSRFLPSAGAYTGPGDGVHVLTSALAVAQEEWDQAAEAARVAVARSYYGTLTPVEAEECVTLAVSRTRLLREGPSSLDRQVLADKEVDSLNQAVKKREQAVWDTSANSALYVGGELAFDPSQPQRAPKKLETADEAAARAAAAANQVEFAMLELVTDTRGVQFELSVRQQRLIQLQHPGAARVVVKKLHGGFNSSLVLHTAAYDAADRPEEPAVTKLDAAAALAKEVDKQDAVSAELGPYAIRILRRPLYLGASGVASAEFSAEHETDADGAVVLELAGACWVLPEFYGKIARQDIIVPLKQHLLEALFSDVDRKNIQGVFDDLYSVGGPLQRLASKATFGHAATAKGGFVATALEDICREVTRSMVPAQDAGHTANISAYAVPATLLKAATGTGPLAPSGELTKRQAKAFERSFVHGCGEEVWGDAACAPLIALAEQLRAQLQNGASWLASWRPLRLLQHGDLNAANVLIDARGSIWLIDFARTGMHEAFYDAAKLSSVLLFEYLPCDNEEMHRRSCAVVDALIPADGTRQLWEEPSALSKQDRSAAHTLALSLAAKVKAAACDLIISSGRQEGRGSEAAADVHPTALWLPLLREALRCLRYRDLSIWQKRTAWHAAQRLSIALLNALPCEPVAPPERRGAYEVASLRLADGRVLEEDAFGRFLSEDGDIEARRYAPGQMLSVLDGDSWHDLAVISVQEDGKHQLRRANSPDEASDTLCLGLHAFNHAPLELSEAAFAVQRAKHAHGMSIAHANISDALSGRPLNTLEQCVPIAIASRQPLRGDGAALAAVRDVESLCLRLHDAHARRQRGERGGSAAVLLTAPPATGKTCLVSQLVMHTLMYRFSSDLVTGVPVGHQLVPLVIKVMDLQRVLHMPEHAGIFESKWNWADAYLCATLGEASPTYRFLRQALLARRVLLLLDGMDEGGLRKVQIERHVAEVLIPQGHPMLLTSRPDSLVSKVYEGCLWLQLCPLTDDQQRAVIAGRLRASGLRASDVQSLVDYVQDLSPDTDGRRLTGNPLMLNMFISIYESRGGMPAKLQQVYELASGVTLGRLDLKQRGGSASMDTEQLRRLLREVALEAHLRMQRQISKETLQAAAARLGASGQRMFEAVAEQLSLDRMPMLSVLAHEPLVVQFSHFSFQEYFVSQAICAIETKREGLQEPWRLEPYWGNAVRLGADCGERFGLGLLRAAGLEGANTLNLSGKFKEDSLAAIAAVSELIKASSIASLNVDGHPLPIANLKGTDPVESIDLSDKRLGVASGMIIASCIEGNAALKSLNLKTNKFDDKVKHALQAASGGGVKLDL